MDDRDPTALLVAAKALQPFADGLRDGFRHGLAGQGGELLGQPMRFVGLNVESHFLSFYHL